MEDLTERVIGAAIKVQSALGNGLLESAYQTCLAYELRESGLDARTEMPLDISYGALHIPNAYRMDLVVNGRLLIERKTLDKLLPTHEAQLMTYLRFSGLRAGPLLNFWAMPLKQGGLKRVLNTHASPLPSAPPRHSA
ncbi:MAG: GxxExxY protein [Acidobacteria bacterium]|nr:GxxExxY protein [Acidobacteriota bacterium]